MSTTKDIRGISKRLFKTYKTFRKDHKDQIFMESTYNMYLGDANAFLKKSGILDMSHYKRRSDLVRAIEKNADTILASLEAEAYNKTSDSWRKLRRALYVLTLSIGGTKIKTSEGKSLSKSIMMKNPAPVSSRKHNPKKGGRMKKISDEQFNAMAKNRMEEGIRGERDEDAIAMLILVKYFGMRPWESCFIETLEESDTHLKIRVHGAKKTELGKIDPSKDRGIDRDLTISLPDKPDLINYLRNAVKHAQGFIDPSIKDEEAQHEEARRLVKRIQKRLRGASHKLFPESTQHFCLYSLRYTFGSNLKRQMVEGGSGEGRLVASAIMGHKNTTSLQSYGTVQQGLKIGDILPEVNPEAVAEVQDTLASKFARNKGEDFKLEESIDGRVWGVRGEEEGYLVKLANRELQDVNARREAEGKERVKPIDNVKTAKAFLKRLEEKRAENAAKEAPETQNAPEAVGEPESKEEVVKSFKNSMIKEAEEHEAFFKEVLDDTLDTPEDNPDNKLHPS